MYIYKSTRQNIFALKKYKNSFKRKKMNWHWWVKVDSKNLSGFDPFGQTLNSNLNSALQLVCVSVWMTNQSSLIASSFIFFIGNFWRDRGSRRGSDYTEGPQSCTEKPDQYSISVISPHISITGCTGWQLEPLMLLTRSKKCLIRI